ncbi:hypothetical protein ABEW05_010589 [Botrytis cinerea]
MFGNGGIIIATIAIDLVFDTIVELNFILSILKPDFFYGAWVFEGSLLFQPWLDI